MEVKLKKIDKIVLVTVVCLTLLAPFFKPERDPSAINYDQITSLVEWAVKEKTFYDYNVAYNLVQTVPQSDKKESYLSKLSSIVPDVWNDEISNYMDAVKLMDDTKSIEFHDYLRDEIQENKTLKDTDKDYLLGEIAKWGKKNVWTKDYSQAVSDISDIWTKKTIESVEKAKASINNMDSKINKQYLFELLDEAYSGVEIDSEKLNRRYFDLNNGTYIGKGKNVVVDLSDEFFQRKINISGNIDTLHIYAKNTTINLDNVKAKKIYVYSVDKGTLKLNGNTTVDNMVLKNKTKDTQVILNDNSRISTVNVNSKCEIDVNTNRAINTSIDNFNLNLYRKDNVKLSGNIANANVNVYTPTYLEIKDDVAKVEVFEHGKNTDLTVNRGNKIKELNCHALIKLRGVSNVLDITGTSANEVLNEDIKQLSY
jgi:hypothetical protein